MPDSTPCVADIPADLDPLSPNPGGVGEPDALVGRESELARLQEAVIAGGAHVTGERRMGKTWLLKRLQDELAETVTAIYVSAETSDLDLFANRLLGALRENRLVREQVMGWEKEVGGELKLTIGVAGLTLAAKATRAAPTGRVPSGLNVIDLLTSPPGGPIVLIIDEITHLCQALGPEMAREFLSGLRSRRQSGGPPLVISGSIGLHHALDDSTPINDLWSVGVGALQPAEAVLLAARLLIGIGVEPTPEVVAEIVRETSAIPYYIHAVADRLRYQENIDVAAVVIECITGNLWSTDHYLTRLVGYYGPDRAAQARALLDVVALSETSVDLSVIDAQMSTRNPDLRLARDELLDLLDKLEKDHYLVREGDADRMSSPLLARIWRHHRRLA